jgi:hypothetical protein
MAASGAAPACVASPDEEVRGEGACGRSDALDEALGTIHFDRCDLLVGADALALSRLDQADPRQLPGAAALRRSPAELGHRGDQLSRRLDAATRSTAPVAETIAVAAGRRGDLLSTCVDDAWANIDASDAAPLARELGLDASRVSGLPLELQRALVPIARAIKDADREVKQARGVSSDELRAASNVPSWILGVRHFFLSEDLLGAFDRIDVHRIEIAAARLALAIERADLRRFAGRAIPSLTLPSPVGAFILSGPGPDVHGLETNDAAFVLDTGGDDAYLGSVGVSGLGRGVSVAIDLDGRDRYTGQQAAGVTGIGMLFDLGASDDRYEGRNATQGVGSHGVGVLFDDGGDDTYAAGGVAQGAAAWGLGLLIDMGGNDRYSLDTSGQGFGFTQGVGVLVDLAGNDTYVANPGDPSLGGTVVYPSAQLPGKPSSALAGNMSFAQGCGMGHRPDWPDPGFPLPGGLGVLRDASGDDTYRASVFAQGCGFVQGIGMLLDGAGDDAYDGLFYVQGAAAHMAAGLFRDDAGNDTYNARFPVVSGALGVGVDLSVGLHWDGGGNDVYRAPGLSLGTGYANGIGLFLNTGGEDEIRIGGKSDGMGVGLFGDASKERRVDPTIGVFVRAGGETKYRIGDKEASLSGKSWLQKGNRSYGETGVGVDRPDGTAFLP